MQWGLTPALQSSTITFPVETSNSLFVELTPQDSVNGVAVLLELNNKGFNFAINSFNATGYPSVAWLLFGIAQQWGVIENLMNNTTFVLPTSFTYVFNITGVDVGDGAWSIGLGYVNSYTAHFWTKSSAPVSFYFVAVGYQQWGLLFTETVNFQIPFDMVFCAFAITKNNVALTDAGATIPALSVSTATMYVNGFNGYWLVVGAKNKQQWGTEPGVGTYEYPVPYTALCYGVITNRQVQKSNNATTAVNITLTEFTCSKTDGMGDYTFNWFSAGV